ncbi:MAG: GNAT family N-acetyltransferase [Anaerolineae bacterium]|nr:GNAT family N-acetyltransferase [Anaerolineae bacterium]
MLEGLLVDLVPYGKRFLDQEHRWHNSEAWFWATAGEWVIVSRDAINRYRAEEAERRAERHNIPSVYFGIQTKDGKPLGDIAMNWVLPYHRLAMLGACISEPEYWGGGYGTDALLLILDYAFNWLDMHKIWLGTMDINERVKRQMIKVGFVLEARERSFHMVDGHGWVDGLLYGMLRDEWPGREAMINKLGLKART